MKREEWWKSFALGIELDAAGTFVYNGIKSLHEVVSFNHPVDILEILYSLSIGIERLLKVAIVLIEHHDEIEIGEFEKSLISHNTSDLARRVDARRDLRLSDIHREFLFLLSKFYKTYRYGRFSLSSVPDIYEEKRSFLEFLSRHLRVEAEGSDKSASIANTDQIRRFIGKVVKKICSELFRVIQQRATELNVYTWELRSDSKALKVFYGERLDFIDEDLKKRELLLFLMSPKARGPHVDLLRSFEALDLDPALVPNYIQVLLNDTHLPLVGDEVDELYTDISDARERLEFLRIMDFEYLVDEGEGEE